MNEKSKLIVLIALIVTALVVYLSFYSPFRPAPGAGARMTVRCTACDYRGEIMLDQAIKKGAEFSGETGWSIKCPQCGAPARVFSPPNPTTTPQ